MAEQYKDPWADATNQAVGALYKYYLSKPSAADLQAAEIESLTKQEQLRRLQLQNKTDNSALDLGNFALPNLSPEIRNDLYRRSVEGRGESDAAKLFGTYVNKPMQVDTGDSKFIVDGSTGLPIQEYGVGVAPSTVVDKEGRSLINTPAIPAANRPAMPGQIAGANGIQVIASLASRAGVDPQLAHGVFGTESAFGQNQGPSSAGAIGPMQTMPTTLKDPGFGVPPAQNNTQHEQARVGVDYLAAMVKRYNGDEEAALIAYNAGPANADKWIAAGRDYRALPKPEETLPYVQKVLGTDVSQQMGVQSRPQGTNPMQQTQVLPNGVTVTPLPMSPEASTKLNNSNFSKRAMNDIVNTSFANALEKVSGGSGYNSVMKDIPMVGGMTQAGSLAASLKNIKDNFSLERIAELKANSATGGFFGNLTDSEREAVADSLAPLQQNLAPQELAYYMLIAQDTINDIVHQRGQINPQTGQQVPLDAGSPRTGIPLISDIQNARSADELRQMWDSFSKYDAFKGEPPSFIANAMIKKMNEFRGQ